MTFNYQNKVKSFVEKRDRLLDKYEDNRDSVWNKANKKYKNILTLIKHVVKTGEKYKKKIYDTSSRYSRYLKKSQEEYEKNYKEILDNVRETNYHKLTKALRTIVYFHVGSKYDGQFVFKSKRLEFERI